MRKGEAPVGDPQWVVAVAPDLVHVAGARQEQLPSLMTNSRSPEAKVPNPA